MAWTRPAVSAVHGAGDQDGGMADARIRESMMLPGSRLELRETTLRLTNGLGGLLIRESVSPSQEARQRPDVDQAAAEPRQQPGLVGWVDECPRERFRDGDAFHLRQHLRNSQPSAAGPLSLEPDQATSE